MCLAIRKARNFISVPINKVLSVALVCICIITSYSCKQPVTPLLESYRISFPDSGVTQGYGSTTIFQATASVEWDSSLDGNLGSGQSITANLSLGDHTISIKRNGVVHDSIYISIVPVETLDEYSLVIQGSNPKILLPQGTYIPYCISLYTSPAELSFSVSSVRTLKKSLKDNAQDAELNFPRLLDISPGQLYLPATQRVPKKSVPWATLFDFLPGSERTFYFVDLSGNGSSTTLCAFLKYSSFQIDVWVENGVDIDETIFTPFIEAVENHILPRHSAIWGGWRDVDGNGKLSILLTPRFNQTRLAIGLFNPADFYPNNTDPQSPMYNPLSNEMDIIYAAIPDESGNEPAFSEKSILATIAHELQHLKSFSKVVEQQEVTGNAVPHMEETFLEEGMAHLAENLSGYGIAGGNIAFVSRYLDSPETTALSSYIGVGYGDSVERRGGMSALLGFLFLKNGGIRFENDGTIVDEGGITFFRKLYASYKRGWDRLEEATGTEKKVIIKQFADFLREKTIIPAVYDPLTSEPIYIDPYLGEVETLGKIFVLDGPDLIDFNSFTIAPDALAFGTNISCESDTFLAVNRNSMVNQIIAYFSRY